MLSTGGEHCFRAMGTDVHIVIVGDNDALALEAEARICRLEARWSRFVASSELNRINAAAGHPVVVPEDTFDLLALAVAAWYRTGGLFDPTVLPALEAAGYRDSFEAVSHEQQRVEAVQPAPGCGHIELDPVLSSITVPNNVALDLGGIGKGHTADVIGARLLAQGARGVLVNMGGDVWCGGEATTGVGWQVGIEDPYRPGSGCEIARVALQGGAVATSTTLRRRWMLDGVEAHHLIDPRSGESAHTSLASVSVVCGSAAWAEVLAKAVLIGGVDRGAALLATCQATGLAVLDDGVIHRFKGLDRYLAVGV